MANPVTRAFLADVMAATDLPGPVVEFGSMQVEAEQEGDLRPLFAGRDFIGTDMRPGPGVDRVEDLRRLSFADGEIGTAICFDTLEHCEDPPLACRELARVVADGGVCLISSVMLFGIHGYPNDYFRFTPEGFRSMLGQGFDEVGVAGIGDPGIPVWVLGAGAKGKPLGFDPATLPSVARAQADFERGEGKIRVGPLMVPRREILREVLPQLLPWRRRS